MKITVVLFILLPAIRCESQEVQLIKRLTNYFHFDHHFFLLDSAVDANQFIGTDGLTPQSVLVVNGLEQEIDFEIGSKNCFMIVAFETSEFEHTITLLNIVMAVQTYQKQTKIGIFYQQEASSDILSKLFEWCIDNQITDAFAATYLRQTSGSAQCTPHDCLLNVFTFHPFKPASKLVNVTSSDKLDDYFQSTNANFHQWELRYQGRIEDTLNGNLWFTIFDLMNASYVEVEINNKTVTEALQNGIDVMNNTYVPKNSEEDLFVYPVDMRDYVVIVPEALPYSEFSSYLINGMSGDFFIYSILSTIGSIAVLVFLRYTKQKMIFILQSCADVFNLLLNDNGRIKYQLLMRAEVFVIVPLTFVGFILVNGVLSNLQSHLTRPALRPQIDTPADIFTSKIPIITNSVGWKKILINMLADKTKYSKSEWDSHIVVDEGADIDFTSLYNKTNAFLLDSYVVDILLRTQKRLNIKGYHRPHIQISKLLFTYMVHKRFLFFERLNDIVQRLKSAGFYDLWLRRDGSVLEGMVRTLNLVLLHRRQATSVERLQFPTFIVYGWLAGFVVFVLEIIWKKFRKSRDQYNN